MCIIINLPKWKKNTLGTLYISTYEMVVQTRLKAILKKYFVYSTLSMLHIAVNTLRYQKSTLVLKYISISV